MIPTNILVLALCLAALTSAAPAAPSFASIDISRNPTTGAQARAEADKICPANSSAAALGAIHDVAEQEEVSVFVPAIQAAKGNNAKTTALLCQLNRNKVLKNTCTVNRLEIVKNNPTLLAKKLKAIVDDAAAVDKFCTEVNPSLFIGTSALAAGSKGDSKTPAGKGTKDRHSKGTHRNGTHKAHTKGRHTKGKGIVKGTVPATGKAALPSFASIDISRNPTNGAQVLAEAAKECPVNGSASAAGAIHDVAEQQEVTVFQPALKAANGSKAKTTALLCQLNRNKVLKNTCTINRLEVVKNNPTLLAKKRKAVVDDAAAVDKFCAGVDTSLFLAFNETRAAIIDPFPPSGFSESAQRISSALGHLSSTLFEPARGSPERDHVEAVEPAGRYPQGPTRHLSEPQIAFLNWPSSNRVGPSFPWPTPLRRSQTLHASLKLGTSPKT
ncbi:hypothetical protein BDK51DRAFT_48150 [Blyttiomyces helicus]|uniref:Uncharacterized protein n=1 Tax=Blyttiomyces helicus TaxID=388810 RepID=A0A4P9VYD7_9FUNG|nr:hypothetical protein BDK51DRAFT_48150 [Blyttiomyces helicus]|eukprot:RKO84789.1 hypothetical protein BDK51DRAFT_48150 [Blyttiomyces helicus]